MAVTAAQLNVAIKVDGANRAKSELREMGDAVDKAERRSRQMGGALLGIGGVIAGALFGATREALSFSDAMANVNSIAQVSSEELSGLSDQVLQLASATGQGPEVLAQGLYDIYSSGFTGADGLKILESAAYAANAGLTTTATSAKAITAVLNAYGMGADQAAHVSDVLFQTVNDGVITFEELSANMANTLSLANALGVSFEQLAAAYAVMTLNGVPAAQAETQIAALMRSALNPTQAMTDAIHAYGYESVSALIAAKGMPGFLQFLAETSGGSAEKLYALLGSTEAVNAALILGADNAAAYNAEVAKMEASSEGLGATQKALAKQMDSAAFSIRLLKTNIQAAMIAIGVQFEPGIRAVANAMTAVIKTFLALPKPVQRAIALITGLVGAVAAAAGAWVLFGTQITAAIALFGSLLGPIALVVAAVAGLYLAWETNFAGIQDITASAFGAVLDFLSPVLDFVDRFRAAWDSLGQSVTDTTTPIMAGLDAIGLGTGTAASNIGFMERALTALDIATGGFISRLREMSALDIVIAIGSWTFTTVADLGASLLTWIAGQIPDGLTIGSVVVSIGGWIIQAATSLWDAIMGFTFGYGADNGMSGDGTGGATPAQTITVGQIAVQIGGWIVSASADLATVLTTFVLDTATAVVVSLNDLVLSLDGATIVAGAFDLATAITQWITDHPVETIAIAASVLSIMFIGLPAVVIVGIGLAVYQAVTEGIPDSVVVSALDLGIALNILAYNVTLLGADISAAILLELVGAVSPVINLTLGVLQVTFNAIQLAVSLAADVIVAVLGTLGSVVNVAGVALNIAFNLPSIIWPDWDPIQAVQDWLPDSIDWSVAINVIPNWLFPDQSTPPPDNVNPGLEPVPVPEPDVTSYTLPPVDTTAFVESLDGAKAIYNDFVASVAGTGARGAAGGAAGPGGFALPPLNTSAFTASLQQAQATATAAMATIRGVVTAGTAQMAGAMVAGMATFRGAVTSGMASAVGAVRAGIAAMVAAASAGRGMMMSAGLGIGAALGQGIAAGIRGQIGAVAAAAAALVTNAVAAARAAGAIHSPSEVMRSQVGLMLGAGVEAGILDSLSGIRSAAGQMVPSLNGAPGGVRAGLNGGGVTYVVNVTVEGNVTTENDLTASIARAVGLGIVNEHRRHKTAVLGAPV